MSSASAAGWYALTRSTMCSTCNISGRSSQNLTPRPARGNWRYGAGRVKRHMRASVYVHFPWCLAKCPYCDFVSYAEERSNIDHAGYADAVLAELDARASLFDDREVGSVFFGGGTPSLWE